MSVVVLDGVGFPFERRQGSPPPLRPVEPAREASRRGEPKGTVPVTGASTSAAPADKEGAESRVRERISRLVGERHRLREHGGTAGELEENRLAIVTAQHELGWILIARYQPAA
jgi:hypothetical protein